MRQPTADHSRTSRLLEGGSELPRAFPAPAVPEVDTVPDFDPLAETYARGVAEGGEKARAEAAAEFEAQTQKLQQRIGESLKRLDDLEDELTRQHKDLMIELALEAASKIVRARIEQDDPIAARALAEAVEALPSGETLRARLNPEDLKQVKSELEGKNELHRIELVSDAGVSRGGCVIEGETGTIDARVETAAGTVREAAESGRP